MSLERIDLRSDTVTRPDAEMRRAMASAEVGDDVFQEDPTVRRLEEEAAQAIGCEAALYVPSGTMGNQVALHVHGSPGSEVVCEAASHIVLYEMGAMAALSGLLPRTVPSVDGLPAPRDVEAAMPPEAPYRSRTRILALENTHNMAGGRVYDRSRIEPLLAIARQRGVALHLDGARIFNAAAALGVEVSALAAGFDSVMFCLSKGLGAPIGSLVCGSREFIAEAWRVRRMFGGGMRQVGVIAAAGRVALRRGPEHLRQDHANAAYLAAELGELPGIEIDPATVRSNILIFRVTGRFGGGSPAQTGDAAQMVSELGERGVLAIPVSRDEVRLVTHRDVSREQIERALAIVRDLAAS